MTVLQIATLAVFKWVSGFKWGRYCGFKWRCHKGLAVFKWGYKKFL